MKIVAVDASETITHVLDRLGFGPAPGDRQQLEQEGVESYIQRQLAGGTEEPAVLADRLKGLSTLALSPVALFDRYAAPPRPTPEQRQNENLRRVQVLEEVERSRLLRALASPHQLQEVMVDFWFNHFNVFVGKRFTMLWVGAYEQEAIRPHALGKFRDLLGATAKHPAMSFYLDNWRNTDPASAAAKGQFKGLNENYARELLELHALGVDGGYTQADVESLTRILTGWSVVSHQQQSADGSGFVFARERHDSQDKVLLGEAIAGGGVEEGEAALDLLAQHPATARHISYKLAQHFVADTPPKALVNQLAERFTSTDGDIAAVLQTLFASDAFWQPSYYQQKFKTPYHYVLSLARARGWEQANALPSDQSLKRLKGFLNQLGMPLYRCRTPDGYPQGQTTWLNAEAMLQRVSLAVAIVNIDRDNRPTPDALQETLGTQFWPAETWHIIESVPPGQQAALLLGSPEMMYR